MCDKVKMLVVAPRAVFECSRVCSFYDFIALLFNWNFKMRFTRIDVRESMFGTLNNHIFCTAGAGYRNYIGDMFESAAP